MALGISNTKKCISLLITIPKVVSTALEIPPGGGGVMKLLVVSGWRALLSHPRTQSASHPGILIPQVTHGKDPVCRFTQTFL